MARDIRDDEFDARQRQLPADTRRFMGGAGLEKAREDFQETPLGSPPQCVDVRSVYDVRPIGAWDFNIHESTETDLDDSIVRVEMSVPDGLIAVLRNIDIWFDPPPPTSSGDPIDARSDILYSLTLNGGDFPYNVNIPMGVMVNRETVFLIGDEFNRIGVRLQRDNSDPIFPGESTGIAHVRFYGNFLLKAARPAALEIGNPVYTGTCVPPPQTVLKPGAAQDPIARPPRELRREPIAVTQPSLPAPSRPAPSFSIQILQIASSGTGGGRKRRLVVWPNNNARQARYPTAEELSTYADLFAKAKAAEPANTQWI